MHSQRTHNQTPKSKKVAYQQATKRLQCSYTWRRTHLHLLLHFLPCAALYCSFLFLLANTACISCIVACFGSNNFWFVALANAVCCLSSERACAWKLRFRSRNAKRKAAAAKIKKKGEEKGRRAGITRKSPKCTGNTRSQARHGTERRHGAFPFSRCCSGILLPRPPGNSAAPLCHTHTCTQRSVCGCVCVQCRLCVC